MPDKEIEVLKKDDDVEIEIIEETEEESSAEDSKEAAPESEAKPATEERSERSEKSEDDLSGISESVKKRIDKLTFKMREAERREQAAIEYAKGLRTEVEAYKTRSSTLSQSWESEFGARLKSQQELVADRLRSAVDRGDIEAQVDAQKQLAALAVEEDRLKTLRLQREIPQQYAPQPQQAPVQQPQAPRPDRKAVEWAEKNEWFGEDQAMTATALAFHKVLVEQEGFDPQSDDYYDELSRRVRREFPHKFEKKEAPKPSPVVGSARPTGRPETAKKQIKLTGSQIALARKLGITVEEYARQVQKLAR